jgi:hypothetical protein
LAAAIRFVILALIIKGFFIASGWKMATCNDCAYYITDEDENGNVTDFHSAKGKESGFCAIRDLFYNCNKDDEACGDFVNE